MERRDGWLGGDEALEKFESLLAEFRLKAHVGNEALKTFGELVDEPATLDV